MKNKLFLFVLIVFLLLAQFTFAGGEKEPVVKESSDSGEIVFPAEIRGSTAAMTSSTAVMLMAAAPQFEEVIGSKLRAIPGGVLKDQLAAMRAGKADFWAVHLASAYRAIFGLEEYCSPDWGPQKLRMAIIGGPVLLDIGVRANSDIYKMSDLKGKELGVYAGSETFFNAYLAFGNLSLDDVKVVPATAYPGALTLLAENRIDGALADIASPAVYEMDESLAGIRYLPMPRTDKAAWARVQKVFPPLQPYTVPDDTGTKSGRGVEMSGFPRGHYVYADQDEVISYALAKVFREGYDGYKDSHDQLITWTEAAAVDCLSIPVPYHEGSIKYFKEIGIWTPEHEAWQKEQLRLEQAREDLWKKALAEAKEKGIATVRDNDEWQKFWKDYLGRLK